MITSLKTPFLDTCPKVWANKNYLYARTSKFYRFLNLFFYSRTVVVDRVKKQIEINVKRFWFFTSKRSIPCNEIKYIDLERKEKNMFGLVHPQGFTETWYVQVMRKNSSDPVILFTFKGDGGGDGTAVVPRDWVGMQYEKAFRYAELVSRYTGAQLFKDNKIEYNIKVDHYKCSKCGHTSPSKIKCMYCGSHEMKKVS